MSRAKLLIVVFSLIFVAPSLFIANFLYAPMHFSKETKNVLVIDKNTNANSLVRTLKNANLINNGHLLRMYIRFAGAANKIKAGVYSIYPKESVVHLLKRIVAFDVIKKSLQITPGNNNRQLELTLKNAEYLRYTEVSWTRSLLKSPNLLEICNNQPSCIEELSHPKTLQNFEGLYLADTYQYNAGSDAETILSVAHLNLQRCLSQAWNNRNLNIPYKSPYELLIVASILEKESAFQEDKKLISGVIVNRLRKNMPLQVDPTVIYALQDNYTGKLSHADMQVTSKYNTYKNRGLPPTPIAVVSCESINAASQPNLTDYLYFVANSEGSHIFSKTYSEHIKAINAVNNNH